MRCVIFEIRLRHASSFAHSRHALSHQSSKAQRWSRSDACNLLALALSHIYAYPPHHRRIAMPSVRASIAALLLVAAAVHVSADDQGQPIRCAGFANRSVLRTLPASAINDGYCDCPHDGQDEPDTGACAGSVDGGWAGVPTADSRHEA